MGDVTKLPVQFRRHPELQPREIWRQDSYVTDLMVWEVCPYLRDLKPCEGCPDFEHGKCPDGTDVHTKRGCRTLAEEACRVVLAAKEKGPKNGT